MGRDFLGWVGCVGMCIDGKERTPPKGRPEDGAMQDYGTKNSITQLDNFGCVVGYSKLHGGLQDGLTP